ncbi:hypothetical protein Droror1_Dr00015026 [Drosera rotundifolia]
MTTGLDPRGVSVREGELEIEGELGIGGGGEEGEGGDGGHGKKMTCNEFGDGAERRGAAAIERWRRRQWRLIEHSEWHEEKICGDGNALRGFSREFPEFQSGGANRSGPGWQWKGGDGRGVDAGVVAAATLSSGGDGSSGPVAVGALGQRWRWGLGNTVAMAAPVAGDAVAGGDDWRGWRWFAMAMAVAAPMVAIL